MKTVKPSRLTPLLRNIENERKPRLIIGVVAAFRLRAPKELVSDLELFPLVAKELASEDAVLDEAMSKVRGEVLVAGKCYPPGGAPLPVSFVRVKVGPVDKRLAVIGNRVWRRGVPTEPEPFSTMPVDWQHAFGGAGFERNPDGRGFAPEDDGAGGKVHPLPNIEDPKKLIVSPNDKPEPAGFAGLSLTRPQRMSKLGTYDAKWLETRAFGFAADIDLTAFNLGQPDQWLPGYFGGDETFLIENMHPKYARLEGALPPLAVRVFVTQDATGPDVLVEVPMHLDTLRLLPECEMGVLVFRGTVDTRDDDAADVRELLLACEDKSAPRSAEHYFEALKSRRDHGKGGLLALKERDLVPPPELGWKLVSAIAEVKDIPRVEQLLQKNLRRRAELEMAEARRKVIAAGMDPKEFLLDPPPPAPEVDPEDIEAAIEESERQLARREDLERELHKKREELEVKARAVYAEQGQDYDAAVERAKRDNAGPPKFEAKRQLEQMRELLALSRKHGHPIEEMEGMARDPAYEAQLLDGEAKLRETYRKTAHRAAPVEAVPAGHSDMFRIELEVAQHNAIPLEARDYSGADLSGLTLPGMDLSGAFLEAVNLEGTDLTGAMLERTVLAHAKLVGTKLAGARLGEANLGNSDIEHADLTGAVLQKAVLEKARISHSSLRDCKLDGASLLEVVFGAGVDLDGASAELMMLLKLDLRGVRFGRARFNKCAFIDCDLRGADLAGVDLSATALVNCRGDGARFVGARLEGTQFVSGTTLPEADFRGANLSCATLRGVDLRRARFAAALLDKADLSRCDLVDAELDGISGRYAMFIGTDLTRARLLRADLLSALLTKANLCGADLSGANLFQSDLAKVRVDGNTKLERAHTGRARMHPKASDGP